MPIKSGDFGIGAVSQMTGIDEHTLRMWERRYGFPHPERSPWGARLYTATDVHRLKLIRQALARGHRPRGVVGRDVAAMEALVNAVRAGLRNLAVLHGPRGGPFG